MVEAGEARRDVYLKNGSVVQASSRLAEEALGSLLVAMGILSVSDRDTLLEHASSAGRLLGDVLIDAGVLTPTGVVEVLAEQARRRVLNCLRPEDFQASFTDGTRPPASFQVNISVPALLLTRVTEAVSLERIATHLGLGPGSRLRVVMSLGDALADLEAGPKHMRLLRSFADAPLAELVRSEAEYETLLGLAYTLWALGRLEVVAGEAPPPVADPPPGVYSPNPPPSPRARPSPPAVPVAAAHGASSPAQKRRLVESLSRSGQGRPNPHRGSGPALAPAEAVVDAWLRAERQDYFSLLGLRKDASPSDVKIAYGGMLRRLKLENPPDDWPQEAKDAAAGLLGKASLAFALLTDPNERKIYREHVEKGGGQFQPANPMVLAAQSLRSAERLRARGRFAEAAEELRRAAVDFPKESSVHLALGRALLEWTTHGGTGVIDEAATALGAAARLDPALDGPWLQLGLLARHKGDEDNARKMFRRALSVNPRNERAAAELSTLEKHSGLFGKLFGK